MNLIQATGSAIDVVIAGEVFRVRTRPLGELAELQKVYTREIPSPLRLAAETVDRARRSGKRLGEGVERLIVSQGLREAKAWPPRVGSLPWLLDMDEAGLAPHVVLFALSPEHPDLTIERAEQLCTDAGPGDLSAVVDALVYGRSRLGPKANPEATTTAPTPSPETNSTTPSNLRATTGADSSTTSPPQEAGPTP